jgi:hypothetical protein
MPKAASESMQCQKTYSQLEGRLGSTLDQFISKSESADDFPKMMEKIEGQLASAVRLSKKNSDLELNEASVIADKLEGEIETALELAGGAAIAQREAEWAEEFEVAKNSLEKMAAHLRRMRGASRTMEDAAGLEIATHLKSFKKEELSCRKRLERLNAILSSTKHPVFARVLASRKRVQELRSEVVSTFNGLAKGRLRKKIAEARLQLLDTMKSSPGGRIFIDHKHITFFFGSHKTRLPMSQPLRFALEELAPLQKPLARIGKNGTVLNGSYSKEDGKLVLHLGERSVAGDSIIYREQTFVLPS